MEDAFQRLDKLTPEEALMAAAETMTVTRDIDDTVKDVNKRLECADERAGRTEMNTENIEDKVEGVDKRVRGVDGRVGSIIQGRLSFPSLAPESVLTLYSVRCKGNWSGDPTGVQSSRQPKS